MPKAKAVPHHREKRRHPPKGGYPRGDETRAKIVAAALEVFGEHGFGGASTRMLADAAGVSLPALQYYFDGKEGVYLACAEEIAATLEGRLGPAASHIAQTLAREEPSRARLFELLHGLFDNFADLVIPGHELEKWVLFIIREQAQPTKAFDVIFNRVMRRLGEAGAAVVGRLLELPANDPKVLVRTLALIGQVLFFRTAREASLRMLAWPDFADDRLPLVKDALRTQITAALGGLRGRRKS